MEYKDLAQYLIPGTAVYFDGSSFISNAIQACQTIYTKERFGKKSQWSHIGIVGSDRMFHESTLGLTGSSFHDGITHTKLEKRFSKKMIHENTKLGFQNIQALDNDLDKITAWWNSCKKKYGKLEIFGVMPSILMYKFYMETKQYRKAIAILNKKNIVDSAKQAVCVAAFLESVLSVGKKLVNVEPSVSVVDEPWLACNYPYTSTTVIVK